MHETLAAFAPRDRARADRFARDQLGHHRVWSLFGDDGERHRDFLYVVVAEAPFIVVIRSVREPADTAGEWDLKTHPFTPQLAVGQRLRFRTKVVATRSKSLRGQMPDAKRGKREDVVIAAWRRHGATDADEETRARIGYAAACEWLIAQGAKRGFMVSEPVDAHLSIGDLTSHTFRGDRAAREDSRRLGATFSSLVYEGMLDVTDVDRFHKLLAEGFGTERAFGFGLVQIAPVRATSP